MKRTLFVLAAASAAIIAFGGGPAFAQATRTFVSGFGIDANPCSLSAPCRSFQHAHDTVAAGGEIVALNAAGYGTITITKSVTITAIGIEASITSNSTTPNAIVISAGSSDVVTIRGLTVLAGTNTPGDGIKVNSAKSVTIRDCSVSGFQGEGIGMFPSGNLNVEVRGVSADHNGNHGLEIQPTGSGTVTAVVTDSYFSANGSGAVPGVAVDATTSTGTVNATLSVSASANGTGIAVISVSGQAQPVVMVTGSKLVNNLQGLYGQGPVKVFVDRTQISGNSSFAWAMVSGASISSYTNNQVNGNGDDTLNGVVQITTE